MFKMGTKPSVKLTPKILELFDSLRVDTCHESYTFKDIKVKEIGTRAVVVEVAKEYVRSLHNIIDDLHPFFGSSSSFVYLGAKDNFDFTMIFEASDMNISSPLYTFHYLSNRGARGDVRVNVDNTRATVSFIVAAKGRRDYEFSMVQ